MTNSQVITSLDPSLLIAPKSSPIENSSNAVGRWEVSSLDTLCLSVGAEGPFSASDQKISLNKEQLEMLPKSLLKKVYEGYSRAVNQTGASIPKHLGGMTFAVKDDGVHLKAQNGEIHIIPLEIDAKFRKTMNEVIDRARAILPDSFATVPRTLPIIDANPIKAKPESGTFNFGLLDEVNVEANKILNEVLTTAGLIISGIGTGIGSIYIGRKQAKEGLSMYRKATENGDNEGRVDGALAMGVGTAFFVTGLGVITDSLPRLWSVFDKGLASVPILTASIITAGHAGILLMSGCLLAKGIYDLTHLNHFRNDLTEILDREHIPKGDKAKQGLVFIEQQISITEGDLLNLKEKFKDEDVLESEIAKLLKVKWNRFVRRVGEDCAHKIADQIGTVHEALFIGDEDGISKAIDLIQEVDKASYKNKVRNVIQIILTLVYLCVGIISLVTPFGIILPILSLVGLGIYIIINSDKVHQFVSKVIFNLKSYHHEERWIKPLAGRDIVPLFKSEFKDGREWNLSKLKTLFKSAMKESNGKVMLDGVEIDSFNKLCQKIDLHRIDFESIAFQESDLTLEQIKALKTLEQFIGREWKLNKLKRDLNAAFEASNAKLILNGVQIQDFETLRNELKLDQINFEQESLHKAEFSAEQIRSLQFLDQLRIGAELVAESGEEYKDALQNQGIELSPDFNPILGSSSAEIQAIFDTDTGVENFEIITNAPADVETA